MPSELEPWIVDIALELRKLRELLEEGLPVVVMNFDEAP